MKQRFRAVELGIFSVISLIFLNSVYHLFTDGKFLTGEARTPLASASAPARVPASTGVRPIADMLESGVAPYETRCQSSGETFETSAAKVRITGPICGRGNGRKTASAALPIKSQLSPTIENLTTRYSATVFIEPDSFSTDFIPLQPGANKIRMEFPYKGRSPYPVNLIINRK